MKRDKDRLIANLIIYGLVIIMIGMTANFSVMINNGGKMPLYNPHNDYIWIGDDKHFYFSDKGEIELYLLADIFPFFRGLASIGDLVMVVGYSFLVLSGIILSLEKRTTKKEKKKRNKQFPYKRKGLREVKQSDSSED